MPAFSQLPLLMNMSLTEAQYTTLQSNRECLFGFGRAILKEINGAIGESECYCVYAPSYIPSFGALISS